MPLKWKFFGIANYLLALFFLLVIVFAIKAFFNPHSGMKHLDGARLITFSIFVIFLNSCFNIYFFHRHLPHRLPGKNLRIFYRVSTLLGTIAFIIVFWQFITDVYSIFTSEEDPSFIYFMIVVYASVLTCLLILLMQYSLPKYLEKRSKEEINKQLTAIGKEE